MLGRQKVRWEVDIGEDLGKLKIQNCSTMIMDTVAWKETVRGAKLTESFSGKRRRRMRNP